MFARVSFFGGQHHGPRTTDCSLGRSLPSFLKEQSVGPSVHGVLAKQFASLPAAPTPSPHRSGSCKACRSSSDDGASHWIAGGALLLNSPARRHLRVAHRLGAYTFGGHDAHLRASCEYGSQLARSLCIHFIFMTSNLSLPPTGSISLMDQEMAPRQRRVLELVRRCASRQHAREARAHLPKLARAWARHTRPFVMRVCTYVSTRCA